MVCFAHVVLEWCFCLSHMVLLLIRPALRRRDRGRRTYNRERQRELRANSIHMHMTGTAQLIHAAINHMILLQKASTIFVQDTYGCI